MRPFQTLWSVQAQTAQLKAESRVGRPPAGRAGVAQPLGDDIKAAEVNLLLMKMGSLVGSAPACYGSSLGSNPDISQKYKMGNISKGVANTLQPAKKYTNKTHLLLGKKTSRNEATAFPSASGRGWRNVETTGTHYTVKKVRGFPVPRRDDITAEDGKINNLFLQCTFTYGPLPHSFVGAALAVGQAALAAALVDGRESVRVVT